MVHGIGTPGPPSGRARRPGPLRIRVRIRLRRRPHVGVAQRPHPEVRGGARADAGQGGQSAFGGAAVRARVQRDRAVGECGAQGAHRLRDLRAGQFPGRREEVGEPAVRHVQRFAVRPHQRGGAFRPAAQYGPDRQFLGVRGAG